MNVIELLMVEHASLRLHFHFARKTSSWDAIYDVEEFVRKSHAKVEDEVVFPRLRAMAKGGDVQKAISRLEADHKLIDKIGEQIRERTVSGNDPDTLRKRILLYATTVESHNASEESLIFPYWEQEYDEENKTTADLTRTIVGNFGLNRYFQITGISDKLFGSLNNLPPPTFQSERKL